MFERVGWWSMAILVSICGVHGLSRIDPLVSINGGLIKGLRSDHGYASFLGVPYGVLDENNLFGVSFPHPGFNSTFEAYESNACPQIYNDEILGTINCLTMDIYVPNIANSRNRLPVMVYIHGGGLSTGSASKESSHPISLLKNDVIVVGVNYRLGVYGFMCLDNPEVSGNQGLKDQVLALRWINENIEAFGGDPSKITLFGESAGGISVNLHMLSEHEKLFHRAIIQSGTALSPWMMEEPDRIVPFKLAHAFAFDTDDINEALAYLSTMEPQIIIKLTNELSITSIVCLENKYDGVENFITEHPKDIKSRKANTIPVIIGNNNNEFGGLLENLPKELFTTIDHYLLNKSFDFGDKLDEVLNLVRHFYIGDEDMNENVTNELTDFGSDFIFNHPTQRMAEQLLDNGAKTVYRYIFSYRGGKNLVDSEGLTGAAHTDELGYLFDMEKFSDEFLTEDQLVIDRITSLWSNFAKYGDPTPQTSDLLPIKWEPITKTTQSYLDIDSDLTLKARPFHDRMAFWDLFYKLYGPYQKKYDSRK